MRVALKSPALIPAKPAPLLFRNHVRPKDDKDGQEISLIDEEELATLVGNVLQLLDKGATSPPNNNQERTQIGCVVRQRCTRVIDDARIRICRVNRERARNDERERAEIRDRIMLNTIDSSILQCDHCIICRSHGDGVDCVPRGGSVPCTLCTIIT